jgi:hypothetical protein
LFFCSIENYWKSAQGGCGQSQGDTTAITRKLFDSQHQFKTTTAKATIEAAKKTEADTVVAAAVASGRIKDDADLRAKWSASYVRDPAGTKSMLDAIPEAKGRPAGVPPVANHNTNTQGQQQQANTLTGRDRIAAAWAPAIKA